LLEFLRTSVPSKRSPDVRSSEVTSIVDDSVDQTRANAAILNLIACAFEGTDVSDLLDELPTDLALFAEGVSAALRGDERAAQRSLEKISPESEEAALLNRSIRRARGRKDARALSRGVRLLDSRDFRGDSERSRISVLAYCTNDKPTATFVKPIGVIVDEVLEVFSEQQRVQHFPDSGDVIAFAGQGRPRQPLRGDVGVWDVAEHLTDKRTHFHLESEARDLFFVVRVPFYSVDADAVREYIKSKAVGISRSRRNCIYELLDGVIIGPQNPRADLARDDSYEAPFARWDTLNAIAFEDQQIILGPLPKPVSTYDCAPLDIVVKAYIREMRVNQQKQLTKAQVREIVGLFSVKDDTLNRQRMARIVDRLEAAEVEEAILSDMLSFIADQPALKRRVEDEVEVRIRARMVERDRISSEIAALDAEHVAALARRREMERAGKRTVIETEAAVKAVFDKAIASGLETLASAQIFSFLKSQGRQGQAKPGDRDTHTGPRIQRPLARDEALRKLKACGLNRRFSVLFLSVVDIAARLGVVLFVKGAFARQIALVATSVGRSVYAYEVPLGATYADEYLKSRATADDGATTLLLNANLSQLELYASPLLDVLLPLDDVGTAKSRLAVVGTLIESDLALPVPESFAMFSMTVDLSWNQDFALDDDDGATLSEKIGEVASSSRLRSPLPEALVEAISGLPSPEQLGVAKILHRALCQSVRTPL